MVRVHYIEDNEIENFQRSGFEHVDDDQPTKYDEKSLKLKRDTGNKELNSQELVLYFRDKAKETGHKYIVSLAKDRGVIARLKKNDITSEELINVIDFIFSGDCDYVKDPSINMLGSTMINSLLENSKLWKKGEYFPRGTNNQRKKLLKKRNYSGENKTSIKDW